MKFKKKFKYYKSKAPQPNLKDVIDFNHLQHQSEVKQIYVSGNDVSFFGLIPPKDWKLYELNEHPGLLFLRNPFTSLGQRYWIVRSLKCYTRSPNKTNLDMHDALGDDIDWWEFCHGESPIPKLLEKMRWVTFGYHHDWDTKVYSEESFSEFPKDLGALCKYLAETLGFQNFKAEAAIVNFYHMDSTLSGHTDHSEDNLDAPLFSFSFGQTAIFLLGGKSIDDDVAPMFLRSGDIVIMSQESRLSYHGVPKIIPADILPWVTLDQDDSDGKLPKDFEEIQDEYMNSDSWKPYSSYLEYSRININVRQVLKNGCAKLGSR